MPGIRVRFKRVGGSRIQDGKDDLGAGRNLALSFNGETEVGISLNVVCCSEVGQVTYGQKSERWGGRIDSAFDLKEKAGSNPMMEGMMQAMLAGRTLSWSVTVPKVLETNGQISIIPKRKQ